MGYSQEIDYFQFAQDKFKGKDIYDKLCERVLTKSEAYALIKNCWKEVLDGLHVRFEVKNKNTFENGAYKGVYLKQARRRSRKYDDRIKGNTTQDTTSQTDAQ